MTPFARILDRCIAAKRREKQAESALPSFPELVRDELRRYRLEHAEPLDAHEAYAKILRQLAALFASEGGPELRDLASMGAVVQRAAEDLGYAQRSSAPRGGGA